MNPLAPPSFAQAHALLLGCASRPHQPAVLALAGVVAQAWADHGTQCLPMPGLDADSTRQMLNTWFTGADILLELDWTSLAQAQRVEPRFDEIEEIMSLLHAHVAPQADARQAQAVACALACASLGHNHLWQDLYLPSRAELSALLTDWFPTLAARNTQNMKWKKFFYKQLCERAEINICKAPTCNVCTDHSVCFGPETAEVIPLVQVSVPV